VVVRDNKVDKSVEGRRSPAIPTHRKRANGVASTVGDSERASGAIHGKRGKCAEV